MNTFEQAIYKRLQEVRDLARENFPKGQALRIINRCDKVGIAVKRPPRISPEMFDDAAEKRESARQAIFNAMAAGMHVDLRDAAFFQVSQMHTQMHLIRKDIKDRRLPYVLESKWISIGENSRPVKEYWLRPVDVLDPTEK